MSRSHLLRSAGLRLLLPLGLLFGGNVAIHATTSSVPNLTRVDDGFEAIMGGELVVDGARFGRAKILKALVTGRLGTTPTETLKLRLLIAQEVARRIKEGAAPEGFLISPKEVQGAVEEQAKFLREQYPDGAYTVENMMEGGLNAFKSQLELTRLFNRTFLPDGDPADLPPVTLAALEQSDIGSAVLEQLAAEWETNKLRVTPAPKNPLMQSILFREIFDYMQATSNILIGSDVPDDVVMRINGDDITVDHVWQEIKDRASAEDVLTAKKWMVNMHLLRKGLADVWLSDEDAKASFAAHAAPFDASMIPMNNFALGIKRFPNMVSYRAYRRAFDSFKARIQSNITPDALKQFAEMRTRKLVGGLTVDVDVILLSAYDFQNRAWKADGWAKAEGRAREVIQDLQSKRDWDDVLDEYSDFYDAPSALDNSQVASQLKYKGRFRNLGRNELMQRLGEDEYLAFVNRGTLADLIFFNLEPGKVGGVKKGPHGWYIPLLRKRNEKPIRNDQTQLITMAEEDYVSVNLALYLVDLYNGAKIEGLKL